MFFMRNKKHTLQSFIEKSEYSELGDFVNISNDLTHRFGNIHISNDNSMQVSFSSYTGDNDLLRMAYGYAQRSVYAGMYFQCLIDTNTYNEILTLFKALQATTKHSIAFQREAYRQSVEFIYSYNNLLEEDILKTAVNLINLGFDNTQISLDGPRSFEETVYIIFHMKQEYSPNN